MSNMIQPELTRNIFHIGDQVTGEAFIGRKAMVNRLRDRIIYSGKRCNISYVGLPRTGKSSLVSNALDPALMEEKGMVLVSENIVKNTSFEGLWQSIVSSVWQQLDDMELSSPRVTRAYENYLQILSMVENPTYDVLKAPVESFFKKLQKFLRTPVVLVLDEFDAAAKLFDGKRHYFEFIRDLASKPDYGISVITISRRQLINIEADAYGNSTFQHIFDSIQVHGFNDEDMAEYRQVFERMGAPLSAEDLDLLDHYAGRNPFLLSIFGSGLADMILAGEVPSVRRIYEEKAVALRNYFDSVVKQLQTDNSLNKLLQLVVGPKYDLTASDLDWYISAGYIDVTDEGGYFVISEDCTRRLRELTISQPIWPVVMEAEKRLKRMLNNSMTAILGEDWMIFCQSDPVLSPQEFERCRKRVRDEYFYYKNESNLLQMLYLGEVVRFIEFYWNRGIRYRFGNLDYDQWRENFGLLQRTRGVLAHGHEDYLQEKDIQDTEMFCRRLAEILT